MKSSSRSSAGASLAEFQLENIFLIKSRLPTFIFQRHNYDQISRLPDHVRVPEQLRVCAQHQDVLKRLPHFAVYETAPLQEENGRSISATSTHLPARRTAAQ